MDSMNPEFYPGESFTIEARNNGVDHPYVHSLSLNNLSLDGKGIAREGVVSGGHLVLEMATGGHVP